MQRDPAKRPSIPALQQHWWVTGAEPRITLSRAAVNDVVESVLSQRQVKRL